MFGRRKIWQPPEKTKKLSPDAGKVLCLRATEETKNLFTKQPSTYIYHFRELLHRQHFSAVR
jgi:hypothetical protein